MTNAKSAVQALLIYGLIVPLALLVGYLMATPTDLASAGTVGLMLSAISLPLLLKWHHPMLVLTWSMGTSVFFLPGSPSVWMLTAFASLGICFAQRALDRDMRFISVPSLAWPILCLGMVVIVTAEVTGGFGMRVFGGSFFGGRRYILILAGIAGFFALTGLRIPRERAHLYLGMFFLASLTNAVSSIIPYGPKQLYFLALIFPVNSTDAAPVTDTFDLTMSSGPTITRFFGMTLAATGAFNYLLARYGVGNSIALKSPWRLALLLIVFIGGTLGGFRGFVITSTLTFLLVFAFEGLLRTKYALGLLGGAVLILTLLVPGARYLPVSVQRSLSTLPLDIDPVARIDAEASSEWRLQMWAMAMPEASTYFWSGKGLSMDAREAELTTQFSRRSLTSSQEAAIMTGEYHSGPLTVLIPFGIWGMLAWIWLLAAGVRATYRNYRHGHPDLKTINTFLFAYFLARTLLFFLIYGNLYSDVADFLGLLGLSIALNHGIARSPGLARSEVREVAIEEPGSVAALS
jgi:hypothetical protein